MSANETKNRSTLAEDVKLKEKRRTDKSVRDKKFAGESARSYSHDLTKTERRFANRCRRQVGHRAGHRQEMEGVRGQEAR